MRVWHKLVNEKKINVWQQRTTTSKTLLCLARHLFTGIPWTNQMLPLWSGPSHQHFPWAPQSDCWSRLFQENQLRFCLCLYWLSSATASILEETILAHVFLCLHIMKKLHIDGIPNLSPWLSLLLYIYNWSLMSKSNMRHCCTLLLWCLSLFQFGHCNYQQSSSCTGNESLVMYMTFGNEQFE